ncbi:hypothetical protein BA022_16530 [Diaphorobacter nitroreducens]|nr:hypothetical protein BA022_16530 [Diaphorobacter nitroreducens]
MLVGLQPDEARHRIAAGVDLVAGQVVAQRLRAALPLRRVVEGGFLRRMVVGDGQGHQLLQRHGLRPEVRQQPGRDVGELQAPLHHEGRHPEVGRNVLHGPALGHEVFPGEQLLDGRHGLALHVLGQAHGTRRVVQHQQAVHLVVLRQLAALDQQLQRGQTSAPGHHLVVLAIGRGHHGEVLQQADAGDARGEFGNRRAAALAHVAARRPQLGQRDQQQFLRRRDGGGFLKGSGVHGVAPIGTR